MSEVVLAHAQEVVRFGLENYLKDSEFKVVSSVGNLEDLQRAMGEHPAALLLTDWSLPSGKKKAVNAYPFIRTVTGKKVVCSVSINPTHIAEGAAAKLDDFIVIDPVLSKDVMLERLRAVVSGEDPRYMPGNEIGRILTLLSSRRPIQDAGIPLTGREWQTLRHLALGLSNADIATLMEISKDTVKEHVQHLLRKMGISDRTQAGVWLARVQKDAA